MSKPVKTVFLILGIILLFTAGISADNIDLVVLLDTSESVFPIFDDLIEVVVGDTLRKHLQEGDFFHLLSFAGSPQIEVSNRMSSMDDMEDALKHILLLQPLGNYTDLLRALQYLYQFTTDLPGGRKKYIVVLTDGIHDPPPDSPFRHEKRNINSDLEKITDQINRKGWDMRIIRLPSENGVSSAGESGSQTADATDDKTDIFEDLSADLDSAVVEYPPDSDEEAANELLGNPSIDVPEDLGEVRASATIPIRVKNHDGEEKTIRLTGLYLHEKNILMNRPEAVIQPGGEAVLKAEIRMPEGMTEGAHTLRLRPEFDSDLRFSPNSVEVAVNFSPGKSLFSDAAVWKYILLIAAVLAALFLIVFFIRKMQLSLDSLFKRGSEYISDRLTKETAVEMVVEGQNTQIGTRNVHSLSSGSRYCVGGDGSPFVIFLHPFPRCIGELLKNGESIDFHVRKADYFPENAENTVTDCLNKKITAIAQNGKPVRFFFRKYISPLEKINRIMRLVDQPGLPGWEY